MNILKKTLGLSLGLLLVSASLPENAIAGRYVLNQTPEQIEKYWGSPLSKRTKQTEKGTEEIIYNYGTNSLLRLFPTLPKNAEFQVIFVNNQALRILLITHSNGDQPFSFSSRDASQLFNYIFGYQPPTWKNLPHIYGHEGFGETKACLGDGVGIFFYSFMWGEDDISLYYDPLCEPPY
ncbi:MAG: hypothetical protein ACRCT1_10695 [Microcoleaceae cyanobacterium]